MHTLSTRTLSALAFERGEDYDPGQPVAAGLIEALSLVEHAAPVIGEDGPYERARQRRRERAQLSGPDPVCVTPGVWLLMLILSCSSHCSQPPSGESRSCS